MRRAAFLALLLLAGCGGGREADPIFGVWQLTRVTGGFVGNGRPVTAGESLTLYSNGGSWRRGDGTVETFRFRDQTNRLGERLLAFEDGSYGYIVVTSDTHHLTLREQVSDAYTFELTR